MISRRALASLALRPRNVSCNWRSPVFFSDSADGKSNSTRPDAVQGTSEPKEKSPDDRAKPARSKLMTVLAGMRVESSAVPSREPGRAVSSETPAPPSARKRIVEEPTNAKPADGRVKVDPLLVDAVDQVAEAFSPKIHPGQTRSELIGILTKHAEKTEEARKRAPGELSHLLAGMKIDRTKPRAEAGSPVFDSHLNQAFDMAGQPIRAMMEDAASRQNGFSDSQRVQRRPERRPASHSIPEQIDIFGAEPLGIFTKIPDLMAGQPQVTLRTWEQLEMEELGKLQLQPPKNAFEEMALWTRQGKLWRFPINNEQDFTREDDVDFSEHIFLDHLIADFPRKGPIKQLMDQVLYGLSCNSYISVQEKKEHVDWLRNYFKEKQHILLELMDPEFCTFSDSQLDSGPGDGADDQKSEKSLEL